LDFGWIYVIINTTLNELKSFENLGNFSEKFSDRQL